MVRVSFSIRIVYCLMFTYWNLIPLSGRLQKKYIIASHTTYDDTSTATFISELYAGSLTPIRTWATSQPLRKYNGGSRRLSGLRDCSYFERLQKFNLQSFELRRIGLNYDLTLTYQIVFGLKVSTFFYPFSLFSYWAEIATSNLVGRLIIASASPRMANYSERGVVRSREPVKFWWASVISPERLKLE